MRAVDGQILSEQAENPGRQLSQYRTDRKPLHGPQSVNSGLTRHWHHNANVTVLTAQGVRRQAGKQDAAD